MGCSGSKPSEGTSEPKKEKSKPPKPSKPKEGKLKPPKSPKPAKGKAKEPKPSKGKKLGSPGPGHTGTATGHGGSASKNENIAGDASEAARGVNGDAARGIIGGAGGVVGGATRTAGGDARTGSGDVAGGDAGDASKETGGMIADGGAAGDGTAGDTGEQYEDAIADSTSHRTEFKIDGLNDLSQQIVDITQPPRQDLSLSSIFEAKMTDSVIAIKGFKLDSSQLEEYKQSIQQWASLRHPNIVEFLGYCNKETISDSGCLLPAIIYKWHSNGNLRTYIKNHKDSIQLGDRMLLVADVAQGLLHLHTHNPQIVHRNLKPDNILIDDNRRARLVDIGIYGLKEAALGDFVLNGPEHTVVSSRPFRDPEDKIGSVSSDIFSLGGVTLEALYDKRPYGSTGMSTEVHVVLQQSRKMPPASTPNGLTEDGTKLWELLGACWGPADKRPSAETFLGIIQGINIGTLEHSEQKSPPKNAQRSNSVPPSNDGLSSKSRGAIQIQSSSSSSSQGVIFSNGRTNSTSGARELTGGNTERIQETPEDTKLDSDTDTRDLS